MARLALRSRATLLLIASVAGGLLWPAPANARTDLSSCISAPDRCQRVLPPNHPGDVGRLVSTLVKLPRLGTPPQVERTAGTLLGDTVSGAKKTTGRVLNGAVRDARGLLDLATGPLRDPVGCDEGAAVRVGTCTGGSEPLGVEGREGAIVTTTARAARPVASGPSRSPRRSPTPLPARHVPRFEAVDQIRLVRPPAPPDAPGFFDVVRPLAFPLALTLMVLAFLAIQGRMDRKDPKLALAPLTSDQELLSFQ